jgi:hypothetical protein
MNRLNIPLVNVGGRYAMRGTEGASEVTSFERTVREKYSLNITYVLRTSTLTDNLRRYINTTATGNADYVNFLASDDLSPEQQKSLITKEANRWLVDVARNIGVSVLITQLAIISEQLVEEDLNDHDKYLKDKLERIHAFLLENNLLAGIPAAEVAQIDPQELTIRHIEAIAQDSKSKITHKLASLFMQLGWDHAIGSYETMIAALFSYVGDYLNQAAGWAISYDMPGIISADEDLLALQEALNFVALWMQHIEIPIDETVLGLISDLLYPDILISQIE